MAIASARTPFPASTIPDPPLDGRTTVALTAYAPDAHPMRWEAELRINLRAERPTPVLKSLRIQLDADALQEQLAKNIYLYPHGDDLFALHRNAAGLRCEMLRFARASDAGWTLVGTPFIQLTRAHSNDTPPLHEALSHALQKLLPLQRDADSTWHLHPAALFAHFLDAGWNLPVWDTQGALHWVTDSETSVADPVDFPATPWAHSHQESDAQSAWTEVRWDAAQTSTADVEDSASTDPRIHRALENYRVGLPISSAALSATTFADPFGATMAMQLADAAVQQRDAATLHTLEITQQRVQARGHAHIGHLAALLTLYSARDQRDEAQRAAEALYIQIQQQFQEDELCDWLQNHIEAWRHTPSDHPPLRIAARPVRSASAAPENRRAERVHPPTTAPTRSTSSAGTPYFEQALSAFEGDDDDRAWTLSCQALDAREAVDSEAIASMLLRLSGRQSDEDARFRALRAIVTSAPSEVHYVRAAQLLATDYDARGEFDTAHAILRDGRTRFPASVLLAVAQAQLLSRNGHPDAVTAWQYVLANPRLEPWEIAEYTQERDAARAWLTQQGALPATDAQQNVSATTDADALRALQTLFLGGTPSEDAINTRLQEIKTALDARPESMLRADLLAQRAVLHLSLQDDDRAAQSWTGALILRAEDPKILAGVAFTRRRQHPEKPHDDIRQRFRRAYKRHRKSLNDDERNALHILYEHT